MMSGHAAAKVVGRLPTIVAHSDCRKMCGPVMLCSLYPDVTVNQCDTFLHHLGHYPLGSNSSRDPRNELFTFARAL